MSDITEKNKRIAKNTLYMYLRMIVTLVVSLFTVRVVFQQLGIDNYGIYNIVGGVIVFFSFLNNGLTSATRRFITTELAVGTEDSQRHVFNTCVVAHVLIALLVLLLSETVGLWFLYNMLNIPPLRMGAAVWVYQFSVVAAVVAVMQSPYNAAIVAYERMNVFAYISILDVVLKLLVAYLLCCLPGDVLVNYGMLILCSTIVTLWVFRAYAVRTFKSCKWKYQSDTHLLKQVFGFMSWSVLGQLAVVGANQGVGVLINMFFCVAVNAAMGVGNQIVAIANNFVTNFQTAFNPQIIKSYAHKEYDYLQSLICRTSKLSSYMVILFLVPICFETPRLLHLWLGDYPRYSVEFCVLTLIAVYVDAISAPLWMLAYAKREIRNYQLVISLVYSVTFFGAWICLGIGMAAYSVMVVRIVVYLVMLAIRLVYARSIIPAFSVSDWLKQVLGRSLLVLVIACILTQCVAHYLCVGDFLHIVIVSLVSVVMVLLLAFGIGLNRSERAACVQFVNNKILKSKI